MRPDIAPGCGRPPLAGQTRKSKRLRNRFSENIDKFLTLLRYVIFAGI